MPGIPVVETARLRLRPLTANDLDVLHEIHQYGFGDGSGFKTLEGLATTQKVLDWVVLNEWFPRLRWWNTRAIELKENQTVIGEIALVPMPVPLDVIIADVHEQMGMPIHALEVSMLWGVLPEYRRKGYATEAATSMIAFAFKQFNLKRIIADTESENIASQNVMRRLGMRIYKNRLKEVDWLEVIGVLENPTIQSS